VVSIQLCTRSRLRRKTKPVSGCVLPVESSDGLWRSEENCRAAADRRQKASKIWRFRLISPWLRMQPFVSGVKTGYWHVFPIDNPAT
jgi:hypothetical protein